MITLPEEAVKAAIAAHNKYYDDLVIYPSEEPTPEGAFHAALKAALPFLPVQVAVKKLEWRWADGVWYKAHAEFGGIYRIAEYPGTLEPFKLDTQGWWEGLTCGHYKTLEDAKAAAQADYERRILAAIEAAPPLSKLKAENARLEDQLAEARKALEPFALVAEYDIGDDETDSDAFRPMPKPFSHAPEITVGHLRAAKRALSSTDHADADHAQARDVLARFRDYVIEGITAGTIMRGGEHHNPIWQEVAGVLHADAGKVEGDGWHVEYEVYSEDEWQAASTDLDGALDYAVMYAADGFKNITVQEVRRRTLPSVPSEGAE